MSFLRWVPFVCWLAGQCVTNTFVAVSPIATNIHTLEVRHCSECNTVASSELKSEHTLEVVVLCSLFQSTLGTYIVCTCELCKPLHREHRLCVMLKSQPPAMAQFLSLLCILLICQRRSPPGHMASSSSASRPGLLSELCNVMDAVSGDSGDGYAHVEHVRVAPAILPEQPYDPCSLHTCCTLPTS